MTSRAAASPPSPPSTSTPSTSTSSSSNSLRRLAQNWNTAGVLSFARVSTSDRHLLIPHVDVPDVRWIDWSRLASQGFVGVIFDKDNTLTEPFSNTIHPNIVPALNACKAAFGEQGVAILSNSAGLRQYDPEGHEAIALERAIGIPVIRHEEKKPSGRINELEAHFAERGIRGALANRIIMVGDRYMTDILFGNKLGLLTIHTSALTTSGEPFGVRIGRMVEERLVAGGKRRGVVAPRHPLLLLKDNEMMNPQQTFVLEPRIW